MKYGLGIIVAGIGVALLSGCASTPKTTGYLLNYDQMHAGKYLEKYWADTGKVQKTASPKILLGKVSVSKIYDQKGISAADCISALKSDLVKGGMISDSNPAAPLRLDMAITEMDPGSASGRVWAGELGVGHAHLQIEGKVVDVASGHVLATFAERHGSSGDIGVADLSGDAGPSLVKKMIKQTSARINEELLATFSL